jgi:hypothetical protein
MNPNKLCKRTLKLLHKSLPEFLVGYDFLCLRPVDHFLRGFALELNYLPKGSAYFWLLTMPLYRPSSFLIVNYSERLFGGQRVSLLDADLDQTIACLVGIISSERARLDEIRTPEDFLHKTKWDELPSTPNYRIDLALTHFLVGDLAACEDVLEELLARPPNSKWADQLALAQELAREAKSDPSAITRWIENREQKAKASLRLVPRMRQTRRKIVRGNSEAVYYE